MGNFEFNSLEDLVFSRSFRNWVFDRNAPEAGFWEDWVVRNPDRREMVQHAKAVIYALQVNSQKLSDEEVDTEVRKALQRLKEAPRGFLDDGLEAMEKGRAGLGRLPGATPFSGRYIRSLEWAALFMGGFLVVWLMYRHAASRHGEVLHSFLASHKNDRVRERTGDTATRVFVLPDGSDVRLGPGSKLYYPASSPTANGRREVYLEGEAFFDIKRNAARPFYVYTGHVITKVLGTRFRVRAWPSDTRTMVSVRSGKVSVYREDDFYADGPGNNEPGGIVLTPNQEIIYNRAGEDQRLKKTLVENPQPLAEQASTDPEAADKPPAGQVRGNSNPADRITAAGDTAMVFNGMPVSKVFHRLEQIYGIPLLFDEEAVSSCTLFAAMGNESFYEKLNVICKAVNATYEVIDGNIVITAPGCK
jgi:ferric-dicitrate binding protein FerR (iron transport regulator)